MNTIPISQSSTQSLIWSCIISVFIAIIILLVAVFPAEYNIDPTGLGEKMGLTVLSNTTNKTTDATVITCPETVVSENNQAKKSNWQDTVSITVPARKGLEYKFHIEKDEVLDFIWTTDGGKIYFDFHGEPEGSTNGYFKSFKVDTLNQSSGSLQVPFTGVHGWYWENKSNQPVTLILKTRGNYKKIGLL